MPLSRGAYFEKSNKKGKKISVKGAKKVSGKKPKIEKNHTRN